MNDADEFGGGKVRSEGGGGGGIACALRISSTDCLAPALEWCEDDDTPCELDSVRASLGGDIPRDFVGGKWGELGVVAEKCV